jgi:hypothetical protein
VSGVRVDVGGFVRGVWDLAVGAADAVRAGPEALALVRDARRVLAKLEGVLDRLDGAARDAEARLERLRITPERLARLEQAVLNIERATLGVEAGLNMLPRALRSRLDRYRAGPGEPLADPAAPPPLT